MMAATPMPAAMAISWMTRISMNRIATNPTTSVARATKPGMSRRRKLAARRRHAVGAVEHLRPERADHLDAVAHGDGEDQERHQDRHRIDAESEQVDDAQLPDDGQGRAAQDQERQPVRLRVQEHQAAGQEEAPEEEEHDPLGAGGHVAHHLGEPDDVHVHGRAGHEVCVELLPHPRLDVPRHREEIEALPGRRIELQELRRR